MNRWSLQGVKLERAVRAGRNLKMSHEIIEEDPKEIGEGKKYRLRRLCFVIRCLLVIVEEDEDYENA